MPWWSEEWIAEQARRLASDPGAFKRLIENEWAQGAQGMFTAEQVAAMVDPDLVRLSAPRDIARLTFLDLGYSRDHTAAVTVYREGRAVVVEDVFHRVGTKDAPIRYEEVEAHLLGLWKRHANHPWWPISGARGS